MLRRAALLGIKIVLSVLPALVLFEVALRIMPGIVPPGLLLRFEPNLRNRVAQGRFATRRDTVPVVRDDGGPPLWLWKPHATVPNSVREPGAVDAVKMDELGFCNPPELAAQSRFDVIAIGDSFTWCQSVAPTDTWVQELTRLTKLTAYNLGRHGIGPYEEIQFLRHYGLSKQPRIVIMNVYEGNDLRDAVLYDEYRRRGGTVETTAAKWHDIWLGRHCYVFNLVMSVAGKPRTGETKPNFRYQFHFGATTVAFNPENADISEIIQARRLAAHEISFDLFHDALAEFARLAGEHGFQPVVVYTPSAHVAYAPFVEFTDPTLKELLPDFSRQQREYFRSETQTQGLTFLDCTSALATAALSHTNRQDLLYFPRNLHLTPAGHRVLAAAIVAGLQDRHALPLQR